MNTTKAKIGLFATVFLISTWLVSASECDFGTKVLPGDADIGWLIKNIPDNAQLSFWDIGPNADVYDDQDVVYLDMPPLGMVNANDLRITAFDENPAGGKVRPEDNDINAPLLKLNAYIGYLNFQGSEQYDFEDPVCIHQDSYLEHLSQTNVDSNPPKSGNQESNYRVCDERFFQERESCDRCDFKDSSYSRVLTFSDGYRLCVNDIVIDPSTHPVKCLKNNLQVEVINGYKTDYYHILKTNKVMIAHRDDSSKSCLDRLDGLNSQVVANTKDIGSLTDAVNNISSTTQLTRTNDIRLNYIGYLMPGTKINNLDLDHNKLIHPTIMVSFPRSADDLGSLRYYDANGNGLYDGPDMIYVDISHGGGRAEGQISVNDLRLSSCA